MPDPAATPPAPAATPATPAAPASRPALDAETRRLVDQLVKRVRRMHGRSCAPSSRPAWPPRRPRNVPPRHGCWPTRAGTDFKIEGAPFLKKYEPRLRDACRKIVAEPAIFRAGAVENPEDDVHLPAADRGSAGGALHPVRPLLRRAPAVRVHFHAFFFLTGVFVLLLERLSEMTRGGSRPASPRSRASSAQCSRSTCPGTCSRRCGACTRKAGGKPCRSTRCSASRTLVCLVFTGVGPAVLHRRHAVRRCAGVQPAAREVRVGELPVEQLVDHRGDEIGAPVLVVDVIRRVPRRRW